MTDSALWISSLTAGTAVLASWVTSRGTARAAQIQAAATERTQRTLRVSEARRSACVSLATRPPYRALEASIMGEPNAAALFDRCYAPFWGSVLTLVSTARAAAHDL
ncbi:hypothetical protein [Streptomyces sp. MZ04]|uniref:hypothetical protein n=1 Tax=Streptomyces sp. MZ04 TaxID=2559236 RepID=UPI00107EDFDA|nr:hypothetical protein [Streptomyces sp. MZ04]TGA96007.1 hypothetical protein E2651_33030 [Streptomyces sp. MZ04]